MNTEPPPPGVPHLKPGSYYHLNFGSYQSFHLYRQTLPPGKWP